MLRADLESVTNYPLLEPGNKFVPSKHCLKAKNNNGSQLENSFSILTKHSSLSVPSFEKIVTRAQIHSELSSSFLAATPKNTRSVKVQQDFFL